PSVGRSVIPPVDAFQMNECATKTLAGSCDWPVIRPEGEIANGNVSPPPRPPRSWIARPRTTKPWCVPSLTVESPAARPLSLINVAALSLPPSVPGGVIAPPEGTNARRTTPDVKYPTSQPRVMSPYATTSSERPGVAQRLEP